MSDWIKENKFAAGMLGIAIVALIGTYFFSSSKSEAYDKAKADYDQKSSNYSNLIRTEPFPNAANQEAYRKSVVAYRGQVEGLQQSLLAFRPKEFKKIRPADFNTRIVEVGNKLKATYEQNGIKYPDKWQLGFETYTTSPPRDSATDFLNYELDALSWLYLTLAKSGPSELLNVYRTKLPVEDGKQMGGGGNQGNNRGNQRNRGQAGGNKPYFAMPVELTFRGKESALRNFLSELGSSKEYFFVVRSMRIQNAKAEIPPKKSDAKFKPAAVAPAAGDAGDPFEGFEFVIPGEEGEDEGEEGADDGEDGEDAGADDAADDAPVVEPAPELGGGEQILGQVLGAEELNVFLQLELIFFRDNVKLPEVK